MRSKGPGANPLSLVLDAIGEGETLGIVQYDVWNVYLPEVPEGFPARVGPDGFDELLEKCGGPKVLQEWRNLQRAVEPLSKAATSIPPLAIRLDPWVVSSAIMRYFPSFISSLTSLTTLTKPFSNVLEMASVTDPFIKNYMDLLCFLLSGLPADGTITAEVAFMLKEWCDPGSKLEFPKGGSQAVADALARGVEKNGGGILTNAHVEEILVENGKAIGVRVRINGDVKDIYASVGVVSNASTLDTANLLPKAIQKQWRPDASEVPINPSFMHLHLGFDASGLEDLDMHHLVVDNWESGVTAEQNVVLISIASVADPSLAPDGKHCLHAYYPATEPWDIYQDLSKEEYKTMKEIRSQALWSAIERVIPDIRNRVEFQLTGSPLTHARYLRRHHGSYGAAWKAGKEVFPFGTSPLENLYCCGDFVFPGIGLPAVAASGAIAANSLVPLNKHLAILDSIGL
jgi:phytoene dehydrogenase-like protein